MVSRVRRASAPVGFLLRHFRFTSHFTSYFHDLAEHPLADVFFFFFQAEDGIRDRDVTEFRRVLFRSEGNRITGDVSASLASRWGFGHIPVIAGGGDNAAGAIGVGLYHAGQAMLSLGTSGVYFAVSDGFLSNPQQAVHSFCHALPDTWHLMSVMLSAASCLDWRPD